MCEDQEDLRVSLCTEHSPCLESLPTLHLCLANSCLSVKAQLNVTTSLNSSPTFWVAERICPSFVLPLTYLLQFISSSTEVLDWPTAFHSRIRHQYSINDEGIYSKKLEITPNDLQVAVVPGRDLMNKESKLD